MPRFKNICLKIRGKSQFRTFLRLEVERERKDGIASHRVLADTDRD